MTGISRRVVLRGAAALGGLGALGARYPAAQELQDAPCGEHTLPPGSDQPSLAALAANQDRFFGAAVKDQLFTDASFRRLVVEQCNILVCTYSMKWRFLEPKPGQFDFRRADRYVDFAEEHGMAFRGHTLVWEKEHPAWLGDELHRNGFAPVERHIRGVAGHYAGRLRCWDVVNEAVRPEDGRADRLRSNVFLEALGPSYIEAAFAVAREADPTALLYYNANPAPYRRERNREHFEGVIALLERLLGRGVPVQGLGLQSHLVAAYAEEFDEAILVWFYEQASALGLEIMITELDVSDKWLPTDVALRDQRVAQTYRRFLDVTLAFPAVKGVLSWGLSDRFTGHNRWPRRDRWAVRALPYDHCMQPKLARREVAEAFLAHDPDR
jgi:endo-1,4-beta-xylanase